MRTELRPALLMLLWLTLLTGVIYPLAVTGIARVAFPRAAAGSLIRDHGRYLRLDTQARVASLAAWNRPVWWPVAALTLLVLAVVLFARHSLRKRERMNARGEVITA